MAYQYFSQPQGPVVPISLYPDAATAGANLGMKVPTTTSAILGGITEGIQTGQQLLSNAQNLVGQNQQNILRQNQIDQLPVANAIQEEQLKNSQTINEINALKLEVDKSTQSLELDAVKSDLELKAAANAQALKEVQAKDSINMKLKSNDPAEQLSVLRDPQVAPTLFQNPQLFESAINQLQSTGVLTGEELVQARNTLYQSKMADYNAAIVRQQIADMRTLARQRDTWRDKVVSDPEMGDLVANLGPALSGDTSGITIEAQRPYIMDATTGEPMVDPETNQPMIDLNPSAKSKYAVYSNGKRVGKLLDENSAKTLKSYLTANSNFTALEKMNRGLPFGQTQQTQQQGGTTSSPTAGPSPVPSVQSPQTPPAPTAGSSIEDQLAQRRLQYREKLAARTKTNTEVGTVTPSPAQSSATTEATPTPLPTPIPADATYIPSNYSVKGETQQKLHPVLSGYKPIVAAVSLVEDNTQQKKGKAVSPKGAQGLMQVMPDTFNWVVKKYDLGYKNINDPSDNVEVGAIYLSEQMRKFGTSWGDGLELALAAYNAGPGRISDALDRAIGAGNPTWEGVKDQLKIMFVKNPGAYKEVSEYPDKVFKQYVSLLSGPKTEA